MDKETEILKDELKNKSNIKAIGKVKENPGSENKQTLLIISEGEKKIKIDKKEEKIVEKLFFSMEKLEEKLKTEKNIDSDWEAYNWLKNLEKIYDPEEKLEKLEKTAENLGKEYLEEKIDENRFLYKVWKHKQCLETKDVSQKRFILQSLFEFLINWAYKLNSQIPVEKENKISKIQEFDGYLYKLSQDYLNTSSTHKKQKKVEKIVEHITKDIGNPKPEEIKPD